jgi:hypothetical protein
LPGGLRGPWLGHDVTFKISIIKMRLKIIIIKETIRFLSKFMGVWQLPKVSLEAAMPNPSTPCGCAANDLLPPLSPLDTPRRMPMVTSPAIPID